MRFGLVAAVFFGLPVLTGFHATKAVMFPRIIMLYADSAGGERYYVTSTRDLVGFSRALDSVAVPPRVDSSTPYLNVAIYWHNPTWDASARDTALLRKLPLPAQAGAPGKPRSREELGRGWVEGARLYLVPDGRLLFRCDDCLLAKGTRSVSAEGVAILRNRRVPINR